MSVKSVYVTRNGLFALLRNDFGQLQQAKTPDDRAQVSSRILRLIMLINNLADEYPADDAQTPETNRQLPQVLNELEWILIGQAERRHRKEHNRVRQAIDLDANALVMHCSFAE